MREPTRLGQGPYLAYITACANAYFEPSAYASLAPWTAWWDRDMHMYTRAMEYTPA